MNAVLEAALNEYRRRLFWAKAGQEFDDLRGDTEAWQVEQEESAIWDVAVADGLDSDDDE